MRWVALVSTPEALELPRALEGAGLDQDERIADLVRGIVRASYIPEGSRFRAGIETRLLEDLALFDLELHPSVHRWFIPWESQHIHFGRVQSGEFEMWSDGSTRIFRPGDCYIFPRWTWVRLAFREPVRMTHVALRQRAIRNRGVSVTDSNLRTVLDSPLNDFAFGVIQNALAAPRGPAFDAAIAPTALNAALSVVLDIDGVVDRPDLLSELRAQAIRIIDEQFTNAALYPEVIARQLGVSLRQLQRAFSAGGISVARRLRNRRLEHAVQMLSSNGMRALSVKEIAQRSGFATAYALRTATEAQYGVAPTELRELLARSDT